MKARTRSVDEDQNNCAKGNCTFQNPKKCFNRSLISLSDGPSEEDKKNDDNNECDGVVFFLSAADNCKTSWPLSLLTTFNIQLFGLDQQDRSRKNSNGYFTRFKT